MTGRRGRRRRKLLDDFKERRGYSHLKEEALDRTMWRARFGRGFGPVVRQTAKCLAVNLGAQFGNSENQLNLVERLNRKYRVFLSSRSSAPQLPQDVAADAGSLCGYAAVLGDTIKETPHM